MRILVLCTGNSARSQMAEGLLRFESGGRMEVHSAGTHPTRLRPEAVAVMGELGIDISGHWSKPVDEFEGQPFDYVMTVCGNADQECPSFPGGRRLHWPIDDPASVEGSQAEREAAFRRARDEIQGRTREFVAETLR